MNEGAFSYAGRARLVFTADVDGDGAHDVMMGDLVAAGPLELRVKVEPAHGPVRLVHNGEVVVTWDEHEAGATVDDVYSVDAASGDFFRVEMRNGPEDDDAMLLFSSAIQVE